MRNWFSLIFALCLSHSVLAITPTDEVTKSASLWLQNVDGNVLQAAYDHSGLLMRNAVTFEKWSAAISAARERVGDVQARDLESVTAHSSFPGVPEGDYMIVVFKTKFSRNLTAQETLSFVRESDGQYHVIGYFVR